MGIVLNWIVQGMLVAATAAAALRLLPAGRARARVWVWWTVVAAVMALPLAPLAWSTLVPAATAAATAGTAATTATRQQPLVAVPQALWTATSLALALWMAWVAVQATRLALDVRALAGVRRRCRLAESSLLDRLRPSTRARLARSGARLAISSDVGAAAVMGMGRPVIALHPALLQHLTNTELDQVVVHEWAHVAQHDALGTLIQRLVQVVAGWHPAVWIAMTRLRLEREMACDEVVVDATGSAKAYAACLTRVAGLACQARGARLAVAMLSAPSLTCRVVRLLARRNAPAIAPEWMLVPAALAITAALAGGQVRLFGVALAPLALIETRVLAFQPLPLIPAAAVPGAPAVPVAGPEVAETGPNPVPGREMAPGVDASAPTLLRVPPQTSAARGEVPADPGPVLSSTLASTALPGASLLTAAAPAASPAAGAVGGTDIPAAVSAEAKDAWMAATQASESIGRGSRRGAVATAGFFTRLSKQVAGSF